LFIVIIIYQVPGLWLTLILCEVIIPIILLGVFIKLGFVSDIDITKRSERKLYFLTVLMAHLISVMVLWYFGNRLMGELRLLGWVIELVGIIVTFYWKISVHLAANSFVLGIVLILFGLKWWPILLILPGVAWSRIFLKKHTFAQTLAGGALPLVVLFIYAYLSH